MPPQFAALMSRNRLFRTTMSLVTIDVPVVEGEDVDAGRDVADGVVGDVNVLRHRPPRGAVLVARRHHNREPLLRRRPRILDDVVVDRDPLRVLELDQVLDHPATGRATPSASSRS